MHYLYICVTCKKVEGNGGPKEGETLYTSIKESFEMCDIGKQLTLLPTACLSGCKKACAFALQSKGKYAHVFGFADLSSIESIHALAYTYISKEDGVLKKVDRPDAFKNKVLARIPPLRS